MAIDPQTTGLVAALAMSLALSAYRVVKAGLAWVELRIAAAAERSRRRDKRARRESSGPIPLNLKPRSKSQPGIPEVFEDEITDMHELVNLERERRKVRRVEPPRPGDRPPRRGTHHDD